MRRMIFKYLKMKPEDSYLDQDNWLWKNVNGMVIGAPAAANADKSWDWISIEKR